MPYYTFRKSTMEDVEKMRDLYRQGYSTVEIGKVLGRDHTTVLYWLGRLVKKPKDFEKIKDIDKQRRIIADEGINEGKSYKEYMEDSSKKKVEIKKTEEEKVCKKTATEEERLENNKKYKERLYVFRKDNVNL